MEMEVSRMGKNSLREIIKLGNLSEEEQMKLSINLQKSGVQAHNNGFAKALGLSSSMVVNDSVDEREVEEVSDQDEETVEKAVEPELEIEQETAVVEKSEPAITAEILQQFVRTAVENAIAPLQEELEKAKVQNRTLADELNKAKESDKVLEGLSKLIGRPEGAKELSMPNVNIRTSPNGDRLDGRLAEFMSIRDSLGVTYRTTSGGSLMPVYPTHEIDQWMAEQRYNDSSYKSLLKEMTDMGKKHGLFRGSKMITESERRAATTSSDVPGGFLEVLSSIMRVSSRPGLVFWQFPQTVHRYDRGNGEVVDIPRAAYPEVATNSQQRLLSGSNTYVPIDAGNQRVRTGLVKMILNEYGRGRSEAPPISIPRFVEEYAMLPLMRILERDLFYDYYNWEDLVIREQWRPTTKNYYNNGDNIVTAAASVTVGGTMTRQFLNQVYTRLSNDRVVPLPDGNYGLVTNPTAMSQLKSSLVNQYFEAPSVEQIREMTNMMLGDYPAGENIKVEGYQGLFEGFHIWQTNAFANATGAEGVATETNGDSTSSVVRTSYAFGGMASGRGIGGSGVQILFDEKTDFGRMDRAIWQSYEAHGPLDVDATGYNDTSDIPQETRVFKVNTFDVALT
jgi:hypothetical protein